MLRKWFPLIACLVIPVFLCFGTLFSAETNAHVKTEVSAGAYYSGVEHSPVKAYEYTPMKGGDQDSVKGMLGVNISAFIKDKGSLSFYGQYLDDDDITAGGLLLSKYLKLDVRYNRFFHFLDHDPLINYHKRFFPNEYGPGGDYVEPPFPGLAGTPPNTSKTHRKVFKNDYDPGRYYDVVTGDFDLKLTLNLPGHPGIVPYFEFRDEKKNGHKQAISFYMCSACHIEGRTREVDENTKDVKAGLNLEFLKKKVAADISFIYRKFNEDSKDPKYYVNRIYSPYDPSTWNGYYFGDLNGDNNIGSYEDPSTQGDFLSDFDVFRNTKAGPKFLFGGGEREYDAVPDHEKVGGKLEFNIMMPRNSNLYFHSIYTTTEDNFNDMNLDFFGVGARFSSMPFIKSRLPRALRFMTITLYSRYENVDNDDVLGEERDAITWEYRHHPLWEVGSATGQNNLTNFYHMALAQLENSALTRDTVRSGIGMTFPISLRNFLNIKYDFTYIDRDHFEVDSTEKHSIQAILRGIFGSFSYRLKGKYIHVNDPFENRNAAGESDEAKNNCWTPFNYNFASNLRKKDLSNMPEDYWEGTFDLDWMPTDKLSLSIGFTYSKGSNDDASDLDEDYWAPTFTLTYVPSKKATLSLSYSYASLQTETDLWQSVTTLKAGTIKGYGGNFVKGVEDTSENHVVTFSLGLFPTSKLDFNFDFSFAKARERFGSPGSKVVEYYACQKGDGCSPTPQSETIDISAINKLSKLSYNIYSIGAGVTYRINEGLSVTWSAEYRDVDDDYGYIYGDEDGRGITSMVWLTWKGF